ncbi:MAG: hypothetical protein K0S20_515, partial [Patescibacteria group bacterium]|nr:hypothetical protein [Patescibacteria group bacterium]
MDGVVTKITDSKRVYTIVQLVSYFASMTYARYLKLLQAGRVIRLSGKVDEKMVDRYFEQLTVLLKSESPIKDVVVVISSTGGS